MKKCLVILLSAFSVLFSCISASATEISIATPEDADDYVNLYYPQTIYNGGVNMSQSQNTQEAYVDPATGSVNVKVTDVTLPGAGGFDLNITRMYSSSNANLFEAYLKETDNLITVERYAIVGRKKVYTQYTDNSIAHIPYYQVGLTPEFFTYLENKTAVWMVQNSSKYEYAYSEELTKACLFDDHNEAVAAAAYLNDTYNEIDATFPYDNMAYQQIDYDEFIVMTVPTDTYDTEYSDALLDDTANERYSKLGIGWEFTFPYIEIRYGYSRTYRYLHFGEKGTWRIDFSDGGDNNLDGYELNDIKIARDSSVTHDGMTSCYRVDEKNGTKHYFGEDGRLLIQEDRFGNQIKFYCQIEKYTTVDGYRENYPYITKIVDTLGREVVFTFETDEDEDKYVYMTITDPNDAENPKVYRYFLYKLSTSQIGILNWADCKDLEGEKWVLYSVADPTDYECIYRYDYLSTRFSFKYKNNGYYNSHYNDADSSIGNSYVDESDMWTFDGVPNQYALLKSAVGYNSTEHRFKYSPFIKNCSLNGSMIFYKAYESMGNNSDNYEGDGYYKNKTT